MVGEDIRNRFTYHAPKGNQIERYGKLRGRSMELAQTIQDNCPDSKEKSLAITNLEQVIMWANAAIARNE